jgi:uncharacterized membrane protein
MRERPMEEERRERVSRWALWVLYGFTGVTLLGYATFGVHPQLLAHVPQVAGFYAFAFRFFAVAHVWLAFLVLALFLALRVGWRWVPAFVALYLISLGSELAGTTTGLPFGEYRYSSLMDPMWFGHVPIVIPLSWFFMALPSYALALAAIPGSGRWLARVLLASTVLVSWDLSLDPAMSYATRYWIWGSTGAYYGMPWLNLFGWYVTGLVLMGALALLRSDGWIARLPLRWLAGFYLVNLALPVGMNMAAGLWGAVVAALVALVAAYLLGRRLAERYGELPEEAGWMRAVVGSGGSRGTVERAGSSAPARR